MRKKRKLILLLNVQGAVASWQIAAHMKHIADGLAQNLREYDLIVMPTVEQPTTLYWLDGDEQKAEDIKILDEEIKKQVRPILHVLLEECLEIKPSSLVVPSAAQQKMQEIMSEGLEKLKEKTDDDEAPTPTQN